MTYIKWKVKTNACDVCSCGESDLYFILPEQFGSEHLKKLLDNSQLCWFESIEHMGVVSEEQMEEGLNDSNSYDGIFR